MKKLAGAVNSRYLLSLLLSILFAFLIGAGILAVSGFQNLEIFLSQKVFYKLSHTAFIVYYKDF